METAELTLFSQVKIRRTACRESESVTLEVPPEANVTRHGTKRNVGADSRRGGHGPGAHHPQGQARPSDQVQGRRDPPEGMARMSRRTEVRLLDSNGDEYAQRTTPPSRMWRLDEAIRKVREVVQLPLRHPEIFSDWA